MTLAAENLLGIRGRWWISTKVEDTSNPAGRTLEHAVSSRSLFQKTSNVSLGDWKHNWKNITLQNWPSSGVLRWKHWFQTVIESPVSVLLCELESLWQCYAVMSLTAIALHAFLLENLRYQRPHLFYIRMYLGTSVCMWSVYPLFFWCVSERTSSMTNFCWKPLPCPICPSSWRAQWTIKLQCFAEDVWQRLWPGVQITMSSHYLTLSPASPSHICNQLHMSGINKKRRTWFTREAWCTFLLL